MKYLGHNLRVYRQTGLNFPVCVNPSCHYFGDCTPESAPYSHRCLVCGKRHVWIRTIEAMMAEGAVRFSSYSRYPIAL